MARTLPAGRALAAFERKITKGLISVGEALYEIHTQKLYKDDFSDFEDYCEARWSMTGRTARRQIMKWKGLKALSSGLENRTPMSGNAVPNPAVLDTTATEIDAAGAGKLDLRRVDSGEELSYPKQGDGDDGTKARVVPTTPSGKSGGRQQPSKAEPKVPDPDPDMRQDGEPSGGTSGSDTPSEDSQPKTVAPMGFGTTADDLRRAAGLLILAGYASLAHSLTREQIVRLQAILLAAEVEMTA